MTTFSELCKGVPNSLIDSPVHDLHTADLVSHFTEWEMLAPYIDLTETDERDIRGEYPNNPKLQRRQCLRLWKQRNGSKATYRKLIKAFFDLRRIDVAEKLKDLAEKSKNISSNYTLDVFSRYLVDCYTGQPHPSSMQWPFSSFKGYVNLELCHASLDIETNGSHEPLDPIDLNLLLHAGKSKAKNRKVVLVEGVAGSGKTTLFWYACNQWAEGKLYQEVKVLIHVSFSDSELQSACKLADLIPYPDEQLRNEVARAIINERGKGVCFLLDACDEAPRSLWQSFLNSFIDGTGRNMLPNLTLVLASRSGVVNKSLTGRVVVKGFSPESLGEFIEQNFQNNAADKLLLTEALEMKPELQSLCCYPLNAVILVHLFGHFKDNLPTTQTGLFHPLICNFLVRHIQTREVKDFYEFPEIEIIPEDLPPSIAESFTKVTQVAYESLIQNKKIDRKFLASVKLAPVENEMLGLLHVRRTVMGIYGPRQQYKFFHLSVQEYLAAIYISCLDNQSQAERAIVEIYRQNPLSPVLSFYAGITRLTDHGVQDILLKVLEKDLNSKSVIREVLSMRNQSTDTRRQLLALSNSMFECQNQNLWMRIVRMFTEDKKAAAITRFAQEAFMEGSRHFADQIDFPGINYTLPFLHMVLHPTDMLSIGNFARIVSEKLSDESIVYLDFSSCSIGSIEFKALANELHKEVLLSKIMLRIDKVSQDHTTSLSIKKLISGQSCIAGILMENTNFVDHDRTFALTCIIEGLHYDSACVTLSLSGWHLNSSHIHHLMLLLLSNITCLTLSRNDLRHGMPLLSRALLYAKQLFILDISTCNIDDNGLQILGDTFLLDLDQPNRCCTIFHLSIEFNNYTEQGLAEFLILIRLCNITLLGACLTTDVQKSTLDTTNFLRRTLNLPLLEVRPYHLNDVFSEEMIEAVQMTYAMQDNPELSSRTRHHAH